MYSSSDFLVTRATRLHLVALSRQRLLPASDQLLDSHPARELQSLLLRRMVCVLASSGLQILLGAIGDEVVVCSARLHLIS